MKLVRLAWSILRGVKDGLVLIFMLLFFGALYMAMSATPNAARNKGGALVLGFDGPIVDQPTAIDTRELLIGAAQVGAQYRLDDVLNAIETAAKDDAIKAVVLDLDRFSGGGRVALENIGDALKLVKAAKKPIYAFATGYYDQSYGLAAYADEIWLDPMGAAAIAGPGGTQPYFKGLIDRLGVNVHVYRVGKYKSFVEPYTLTQQSPEARAANVALVDAIWSNWKARIAAARPKAKLDAYIAAVSAGAAAQSGDLAKASIAAGIVDKLGDFDTFGTRVATLVGNNDDDIPSDFKNVEIGDYIAANPRKASGSQIGIVHVAGSIVDGEAPSGTAGGETIATLIRDGLANNDLKALVVRVDSPGGSAFASERIRLAILEAKKRGLPVIVSMGNVAASGGYWVAMAGDKIYAEPSTLTGSIGVFGIVPTFEKTLARYGVTSDGVKATPLSGQPDIIGGTNAQTDAMIQAGINTTYDRFLALVSQSRKLPLARVAEIAQGRVWDGGSARQIGLVDAFGSLDDAVAEAARRAKLDPSAVRRVMLDKKPGFLFSLINSAGQSDGSSAITRSDIFTRMIAIQHAQFASGFVGAAEILGGPVVQLRCLECPAAPVRTPPMSILALIKDRFFK